MYIIYGILQILVSEYLQEKQIVSAEGTWQERSEKSANCKDTRRKNSELRYWAGKSQKTAYDRFRTISAEFAQSDGHLESGKSFLHQMY